MSILDILGDLWATSGFAMASWQQLVMLLVSLPSMMGLQIALLAPERVMRGGKATMYFYSKFRTGGEKNWMGENDLTCENDEALRRRLIENKVFVATYWPQEEGSYCMSSPLAQACARKTIPLPIDQRYSEDDMLKIVEIIHG